MTQSHIAQKTSRCRINIILASTWEMRVAQKAARRLTGAPRCRHWHTKPQWLHTGTRLSNKQTFEGYYEDLLDAPLPLTAPVSRQAPALPPLNSRPSDAHEEKIAKARIVFGSRLAGPGERKKELEAQSRLVAGVLVPPKPEEPDNCCMSGCVNCVWDRFRDEMEDWAEKSKEAQKRMSAAASTKEDRGSEVEGQADLFEGVPVGIREFMKTEKKLKARKMRTGVEAAG